MSINLKYSLPLALVIRTLCGLLYVIMQQHLRLSANDPQIQMAEDMAINLANGQSPQILLGSNKIDMSLSLAPFVIVYDVNGQPLYATVQLDGQIPHLPPSIFDYVKTHNETRITWQPKDGVRSAIVMTQFVGPHAGFVLVGRSLREVEKREAQLLLNIGLAWIVTLTVAVLATVIFFDIGHKKRI